MYRTLAVPNVFATSVNYRGTKILEKLSLILRNFLLEITHQIDLPSEENLLHPSLLY